MVLLRYSRASKGRGFGERPLCGLISRESKYRRMTSGVDARQDLACLLQHKRRASGLTQAELAAQAKVSRRTIIRWESGEVSPWIPELRAVLEALKVSGAEAEAISLKLRTPRAWKEFKGPRRKLRGAFLKTVRIRSGKTIPALAIALGCNGSTIARWESGEVEPSDAWMQKLQVVLDIGHLELEELDEEMARPRQIELGDSDVEEELAGIEWPWDPRSYVLMDVRFLSLLDWLLASGAPERNRCQVWSRYAERLLRCGRYIEAATISRNAIRAEESDETVDPDDLHRSGLVLAKAQLRSPSTRAARMAATAIEWLYKRPLNLDHYSQLLVVTAEKHLRNGNATAAVASAAQALSVVRDRRPELTRERQFDQAAILIQVGCFEEALDVLPAVGDRSPAEMAWEALLWASTLQGLGRSEDAEHWREVAQSQVQAYNLAPLVFSPFLF